MTISTELHDRVTAKVTECIRKLVSAKRATKIVISVTYRTDMKVVAGLAYSDEMRIELSEPLLLSNIEDFFNTLIPHEVAHIITDLKYPNAKQAHGVEWKNAMRMLGIADPKSKHLYDVTVCPDVVRYRYVCSCPNRTFRVTKQLHSMMQKHARFCNDCDGRAVYWPAGD